MKFKLINLFQHPFSKNSGTTRINTLYNNNTVPWKQQSEKNPFVSICEHYFDKEFRER